MTDPEGSTCEADLTSNSPQQVQAPSKVEPLDTMVCDCGALGNLKEALPDPGDEFEKHFGEVDGGTLAPSCVEELNCSTACDSTTPSCQDIGYIDEKLRPIQQQLEFLISKANDLQNHLLNRQDHVRSEGSPGVVPTFLHSCQPYFTYLESTARSMVPQSTLLHTHIRSRLLDFSQRLCARLVQLVQSYAEYDFLSLDETKPDSISYFCIGQCQIDRVRLAIFHYCRPQPYLARINTGLYKCIRWNVERPRDNQPQQIDGETEGETTEKETVINTEYYFLCYEDIPDEQMETSGDEGQRAAVGSMVRTSGDEGQRAAVGSMVRTSGDEGQRAAVASMVMTSGDEGQRAAVGSMVRTSGDEGQRAAVGSMVRIWSIGQWAQTHPDPETEDIYDWIMCEVPQAQYRRLLCLGREEPSTCSATDYLLGALLTQQTPDKDSGTGQVCT